MAASKIETQKLASRIEALITAGTTTSQAISAALKTEGHDISQPTIARYLKKVRETRTDETRKIVEDHVQKTVPADLDALETIEGQCLEWSQEDNGAFADRLASRHIAAHIVEWRSMLLAVTDEAAAKKTIKDMMAQCLSWMADDISLQKKRLGAMRMAATIIDMKLRYAGLISADKDGSVFILGREDTLEQDPSTGRLTVHMGGAHGSH